MTPTEGGDSRIWDAVTDLSTYVLVLDAESRQLGERLAALAGDDAASPERTQLERRHQEIDEKLEALRGAIAMLRALADAAGSRTFAPHDTTQPSDSPAT